MGHTPSSTAARLLISRSILSSAIYELWGTTHGRPGTYDDLHASVCTRSAHLWPQHKDASFRFTLDSFQGSHTPASQRDIIESFAYTAFTGPIRMSNPDQRFVVFEDYHLNALSPHTLHLGRLVAESARKAINKYTLKKRDYIATTSMDAELSLVTANLALAAQGKLAYDPFMGTGSFPLACAHFGASVFGSDLDGRSIRGKKGRNVLGNFAQYGTEDKYLGGFVADLTNTPLRLPTTCDKHGATGFLDAILADPPYGVREGLKVLGSTKTTLQQEVLLADGTPAHLAEAYVPPKRAYSFTRMLDDVLDFAAAALVQGSGRLAMWMPVAGATDDDDEEDDDDDESGAEGGREKEYAIPSHPALELVSECTQHFNKWSRRLLTYRRRRDEGVDGEALREYRARRAEMGMGMGGGTADSMNEFRRKVSLVPGANEWLVMGCANGRFSTSRVSRTRGCRGNLKGCRMHFERGLLGAVDLLSIPATVVLSAIPKARRQLYLWHICYRYATWRRYSDSRPWSGNGPVCGSCRYFSALGY